MAVPLRLFDTIGQVFDLTEYALFRFFLFAMLAWWIYQHWKQRNR